jgi:sigma-B regulation protein RsbU (phosphoserine phosphatase)
MAENIQAVMKEQLLHRKEKLEDVLGRSGEQGDVRSLLLQVDAALRRMEERTYGLCLTCHDPIEQDRLMADPLLEFCLDHLTPVQQRALEEDLSLAVQVQRGLLPSLPFALPGWEAHYYYRPASAVSGDYCDLVPSEGEGFHFFLGDVSGKGVAASMLMSNLHALFRALIPQNLPLGHLVMRASRFFCESTLPMHYATLICGRAGAHGAIEFCNAGHPPLLHLRDAGVEEYPSTGLPIGVFCDSGFRTERFRLAPGEALLAYTDGLIEAKNATGEEFGRDRLRALGKGLPVREPRTVAEACLKALDDFRGRTPLSDDLTLMVLRHVEP